MSDFIDVSEKEKAAYNAVVSHPLQSYEWGEFRAKTGVTVVRKALEKNGKIINGFTATIHPIPHAGKTIGYIPKGDLPTKEIIDEIESVAKKYNSVYMQLEPNIIMAPNVSMPKNKRIVPSFHPLFTQFTFMLDISKSEEELLKNMHPKTRYNIKVAQKHGVIITQDSSEKAFQKYLALTNETTKRQKFFAHTDSYHTLQWETLPHVLSPKNNSLSSHLFTATYNKKTLASWIVFIFKDVLYYPYGASSSEHRETMASNLLMWEVIRFGKKHNLKMFDMWGALGPEPDKNDPWFGFHRFKQGYGATLTQFIGSYDVITNAPWYPVVRVGDKARWTLLRLKKSL